MQFPDYGLSYKYGGWHLTRTVAIGEVNGRTRVFVAAGSSCNYCQEREVLRAAVVSMDPDGKNATLVAQGMRNAVDLHAIAALDGALFATNMGDDHLGDKLPEDTFFRIDVAGPPRNYGWPACYFTNGKPAHDETPLPALNEAGPTDNGSSDRKKRADDSVYGRQEGVTAAGTNLTAGGGRTLRPDPNADLGRAPDPLKSCEQIPAAYTTFAAHSSPLGFEYFASSDPVLHSVFLVALHGASHPRIGTGYRVVQFTAKERTPRDFITGFMTKVNGKAKVHGRPCGILRIGPDSFLLSDDYLGLIYFIHPHPQTHLLPAQRN